MGKAVENAASLRGHEVVAKIDKGLSNGDLADADIWIDFTHPEAAVTNIARAAEQGKNIIVGTTGWYEHLDEAKAIIARNGTGLLYAPNFSLGVNLFMHLVNEAAQLMNRFPMYDVGGSEVHHSQKADIPSGTAQALGAILLSGIDRKERIAYGNEPYDSNAIHFPSIRCGAVPGTHTIMFSSTDDTITLSHEAHSRQGFANGAVTAAEWLGNRQGFFTIDDLIATLRGQS